MNNFNTYKKILKIFTLPVLVLYSFFLINSHVPIANGTDIWYKIKEYIIIPIVRTIANSLTAKVHNKVKDVIRGVGGQGPAFIQNWREEINGTESRGLDIFRTILGNSQLCPHLSSDIKSSFLADKFTGATTSTKKTGQKVEACIKACDFKNINLSCNNKSTERDRIDCVFDATSSCVKKCSKNANFNTCFDGDGPDAIGNIDDDACNSNENCFRNVVNAGLTCVQKTIIGVDKKAIDANTASTVNDFTPAGETPFSVLSKCTLPSNFNPETFAKEFAVQGGLETFRKLLEPQNNKLGFLTFIAGPELAKQKKLTENADTGERNSGSGFKPFRSGNDNSQAYTSSNIDNKSTSDCLNSCPLSNSCRSSDQISGTICARDEASSCALSCSNSSCVSNCTKAQYQSGTLATFEGIIACSLECNAKDSPKGDGKIYSDINECLGSNPYDYCVKNTKGGFGGECPDDEKVVGRCVKLGGIVTPGQILNSALGGTLGSQVDKLVKARDWTDLLAQLIEIVGGSLTNFIDSKLLNENPSVVSDGNQYAQQNPGNGINDQNSNGTDAFSNLNQCLANCDIQSASECTSKEADKQSVCENTKRLACYGTCSSDTQGNNSNREQKRRLGDTCQGDKSTTHPDLSYTPVSQNDEANPSANAKSICANGINADPRPGCTPSAQDDCKQKVPLICYKQNQACIQCLQDSDCDVDFPEIPGVPGTKRVCDTRFATGNTKIGVCVREGGGNKDREACLDDSQCSQGLVCNGNHRCRPPSATNSGTTGTTGGGTASTSADFDLFIEIVDIDFDNDDELICPNAEESDDCTLAIDPDVSLDLDIFNNTSAVITAVNAVILEQISGTPVIPAPTISYTPPSPLSPAQADIDLSTLGANTSWKAYIKAGDKIISNTVYFSVIDSR